MSRATQLQHPARVPLRGIAYFLGYAKRIVASTLVMLIAVTSILFFVEGNTVVVASDDSYLEVITGTASIKRPDLIIWENIDKLTEVQAGDLIRVDEGSEVVLHFFDDTQIRLAENSLFLLSQLAVSPSFGRQAIIEGYLNEGKAWVQTLNAEDGHAGVTLSTEDAQVRAVHGTFNLVTQADEPSSVIVIDNKVQLTSLVLETRQAVQTLKLSGHQKAKVNNDSTRPIISVSTLAQEDLANSWAQNNLHRDSEHLTNLRETGIQRLTAMAGTLPGQMLYPIKQVKERLRLAFNSDPDSELSLQIEIANSRLNEALVLFESGEEQKGREALMAYQALARQIAEMEGVDPLGKQLIVPHQKVLTAELPNDLSAGLVKDALQQTAEILADNPVELERLRLANSIERLQDVTNLISEGAFEVAKERLASHQLAQSDALAAANAIEDEALKKEVIQQVLELRQEELALLQVLSKMLSRPDTESTELAAIVESASELAEENIEITLAAALPLLPELTQASSQPSGIELRIAELIDRIYLYDSWAGRQNQIERLLKNELANPSSIDYLIAVRDSLEGRAQDYLNVRILQLQKKADFQKHKAMQRKIERAKRLRET